MEEFNVYSYNLPLDSEEGESMPTEPFRMDSTKSLEEANSLAAQNKERYTRVVVVRSDESGQELVSQYKDGSEAL